MHKVSNDISLTFCCELLAGMDSLFCYFHLPLVDGWKDCYSIKFSLFLMFLMQLVVGNS